MEEDLFRSEDDQDTYDNVSRLYELIHNSIKNLLRETGDVTVCDIMAAIGLVAGEVAEMYVDCDDGSDEFLVEGDPDDFLSND